MSFEPGSGSWKGLLVALVVVVVLGLGATILLGGQVSAVLSTVGASVGGHPYDDGGEPEADLADDAGAGAGQEGGREGSEGDGGGSGSSSDGTGSGDAPLLDIARPELLVIKTGEITVQVDEVDAALNAATQAIDRLGGYASGSSRSGTGAEAVASITFRIPVAAWDDALIALRSLGGTILDEHADSEDVTAEVVDIEARVRNLRVTEAALQAIMTRATAIDDVLTVQEELTSVRAEIEQLQSQAGRIREQAGMSRLTMHFRRTPAPAVTVQEDQFDPATEADAATAHLVSVMQALAKVGIWLGIVWLPILAVIGVVGWIGLLTYRRLRPGTAG